MLNECHRQWVVVSAPCDLSPEPPAIARFADPMALAVAAPSSWRSASSSSSQAARVGPPRIPTIQRRHQQSLHRPRRPPMSIPQLQFRRRSAKNSRSCCLPIRVRAGAGSSHPSTTRDSLRSDPDSVTTRHCSQRPRAQRPPRQQQSEQATRPRHRQPTQRFPQFCRSCRLFPLPAVLLAPRPFRSATTKSPAHPRRRTML